MIETTDQQRREAAYAILDFIEPSSPDALAKALEALRIAPELSEAHAAAAAAMRQDSVEAAIAWSAAREIARRDLGARIETDAGDLWFVSFGREFLRAGFGYAFCCLARREHGEAVAQLTRLLALDPADHLGARYVLGPALLGGGRLTEFEGFRQGMADEERADWLYADALHAIVAKTPAAERKRRLSRAVHSNGHVLNFLLSAAPLNPHLITYSAAGSVEEAYALAASPLGALWIGNGAALRQLARLGA
ncbi:hypothetical protein [Caulobacter sp. Root343]|uniref:hypothetical protein n=1 Tax=Caulobacter sp. Root343 TaxID=1736520 RepID=UPI0006F9369B|nr:hypothetical protein [Caulobacter sp. Root343]KQV64068.1 hypothetical protein ASC70_19795 [Caulobacter sp. Root343]